MQNWIKSKISIGEWGENEKIPSETMLAEMLGISRGTIKQAIKQLSEEGILIQIHGKGTFVVKKQLESSAASNLVSIGETLHNGGGQFETKLLEMDIQASEESHHTALQLSEDEQIYYLKRLRYYEDTPVILLENHLPVKMFPELTKFNFDEDTLFNIIEREYQIKIRNGRRSFWAINAEGMTANLLEINEGTPIIFLEQITYSDGGKPIESSKVWIRSDKVKLTSILEKT